jgi:VanZ family protein
VAVAAVLMATLWPFDAFPRNGVTWLPGVNGLRLEQASLLVSDRALAPAETQATDAYSLELLVRPAGTKSVSTILTFYVPTRPHQFLVRQYKDGLLVTHDASVESDRTKTIKFDVDRIFHPEKLVLVTLSSEANGTTVFLDGQPAGFFPRFRISRSELAGHIVVGTSAVNFAPWQGELRGLAIYSKPLTPADALRHYKQWIDANAPPDLEGALARYTFAEAAGSEVHNQVASGPNLEIPTMFSVPHKYLLRAATKEFKANWAYLTDVLANIAGFMPLGLIVCAYVRWIKGPWKSILVTTIACGILSLGIEVLQYYVPRRGSGITDIIANTLGAALGAALTLTPAMRRAFEQMKLMPRARRSATE